MSNKLPPIQQAQLILDETQLEAVSDNERGRHFPEFQNANGDGLSPRSQSPGSYDGETRVESIDAHIAETGAAITGDGTLDLEVPGETRSRRERARSPVRRYKERFANDRFESETGTFEYVYDRELDIRQIVQTGPKENITDPMLFRAGIKAQMSLFGTEGEVEQHFKEFRKRDNPAAFFKVGRVFRSLWIEERELRAEERRPSKSSIGAVQSSRTDNAKRVFASFREFVVIREASTYCTVLAIVLYGRRGSSQAGWKVSNYGIIYTGNVAPKASDGEISRDGEAPMQSYAIRVNADNPKHKLDPTSRIDYGTVLTIRHNVKVQSFGMVHPRYLRAFLRQCQDVLLSNRIPAAMNTAFLLTPVEDQHGSNIHIEQQQDVDNADMDETEPQTVTIVEQNDPKNGIPSQQVEAGVSPPVDEQDFHQGQNLRLIEAQNGPFVERDEQSTVQTIFTHAQDEDHEATRSAERDVVPHVTQTGSERAVFDLPSTQLLTPVPQQELHPVLLDQNEQTLSDVANGDQPSRPKLSTSHEVGPLQEVYFDPFLPDASVAELEATTVPQDVLQPVDDQTSAVATEAPLQPTSIGFSLLEIPSEYESEPPPELHIQEQTFNEETLWAPEKTVQKQNDYVESLPQRFELPQSAPSWVPVSQHELRNSDQATHFVRQVRRLRRKVDDILSKRTRWRFEEKRAEYSRQYLLESMGLLMGALKTQSADLITSPTPKSRKKKKKPSKGSMSTRSDFQDSHSQKALSSSSSEKLAEDPISTDDSAPTNEPQPSATRSLQELFEQCMADYNNVTKMESGLKEVFTDLNEQEYNLQKMLNKLVDTMSSAQFADELREQMLNEPLPTEYASSPEGSEHDDLPELVADYFSRAGDVKVLVERLQELDDTFEEEKIVRDFQRDLQDSGIEWLEEADKAIERQYLEERAGIEHELEEARNESEQLEQQCRLIGLDPNNYRLIPPSLYAESIKGSVPAAPGPEPPPRSTNQIHSWLATVTDANAPT